MQFNSLRVFFTSFLIYLVLLFSCVLFGKHVCGTYVEQTALDFILYLRIEGFSKLVYFCKCFTLKQLINLYKESLEKLFGLLCSLFECSPVWCSLHVHYLCFLTRGHASLLYSTSPLSKMLLLLWRRGHGPCGC